MHTSMRSSVFINAESFAHLRQVPASPLPPHSQYSEAAFDKEDEPFDSEDGNKVSKYPYGP